MLSQKQAESIVRACIRNLTGRKQRPSGSSRLASSGIDTRARLKRLKLAILQSVADGDHDVRLGDLAFATESTVASVIRIVRSAAIERTSSTEVSRGKAKAPRKQVAKKKARKMLGRHADRGPGVKRAPEKRIGFAKKKSKGRGGVRYVAAPQKRGVERGVTARKSAAKKSRGGRIRYGTPEPKSLQTAGPDGSLVAETQQGFCLNAKRW